MAMYVRAYCELVLFVTCHHFNHVEMSMNMDMSHMGLTTFGWPNLSLSSFLHLTYIFSHQTSLFDVFCRVLLFILWITLSYEMNK